LTSGVHVYDKLLEDNKGKRIELFRVIPTLTRELMEHKKKQNTDVICRITALPLTGETEF